MLCSATTDLLLTYWEVLCSWTVVDYREPKPWKAALQVSGATIFKTLWIGQVQAAKVGSQLIFTDRAIGLQASICWSNSNKGGYRNRPDSATISATQIWAERQMPSSKTVNVFILLSLSQRI